MNALNFTHPLLFDAAADLCELGVELVLTFLCFCTERLCIVAVTMSIAIHTATPADTFIAGLTKILNRVVIVLQAPVVSAIIRFDAYV